MEDACGICGGSGTDVDADGICDDIDNCTDLSACNYNDGANPACLMEDACGICGGSGFPAGDLRLQWKPARCSGHLWRTVRSRYGR